MTLKIDETDAPSVAMVNRKLESFVEIVLKKMTDLQAQNKALKERVKKLEKGA